MGRLPVGVLTSESMGLRLRRPLGADRQEPPTTVAGSKRGRTTEAGTKNTSRQGLLAWFKSTRRRRAQPGRPI